MSFIKRLFKGFGAPVEEEPIPDINIQKVISQIQEKEEETDIEPGRKIHSFHYGLFEIRTDRDITGHYRVTVWQGKERQYSFTIFAKKGDFPKLKDAFIEINAFLKGDQKVSSLPKNDVLKGFFYGH